MRWSRAMVERLLAFDGLAPEDLGEGGVERASEVLGQAFPDASAAAAALEGVVRSKRFWSEEENELLRDLYPDTSTKDLARAFRRPPSQIYQGAARLDLQKSPEYLSSPAACRLRRGDDVGAAYRFPKGHRPWNKGMKGLQPKGRAVETQFKPGQVPHTWMPIGAVREIKGYLYVKVSDVRLVPWTHNWRPVHHVVWEEHHDRPLPDGHVLRFRDGDANNFDPGNLELITRRQNMARNTIHRYPEPVKDAIRTVAKLKRTIHRLEEDSGT